MIWKALFYSLALIVLGIGLGVVLWSYLWFVVAGGIITALYLQYRNNYEVRVQEEQDNKQVKMKKKVCVIGAGASGLVVLKELLAEGHEVQCYEASDDIAGVFSVPKKDASRSYANLHLTISNYYMAFSDYPPKEEWKFWTGREYANYLQDYANHFLLMPHIALSARVQLVQPEGKGYRVSIGGREETEYFDAVCVAVGSHQVPNILEIPGLSSFAGPVRHSYDFGKEGSEPYRNLRVVTVGIGESASDIVKEISNVTQVCYSIVRQYPFCIPRMLPDGHPNDVFTGRLFYPNQDDNWFVWFLALLIFVFLWFPLSFTRWAYPYQQWRKRDPRDPTTTNCFGKCQRETHGWLDEETPRTIEIIRLLCSWHTEGNSSWVNKSVNKNISFVPNILNGKIRMIKSEIKEVRPHSVVLLDDTEIECDAIFFCTGYKDRFPFLAPSLTPENNDVRSLFYHAFKCDIGSTLCFAGACRPPSGAIPGCSELVGRYFALLCSGKRRLPVDIVEQTKQQIVRENRTFRCSPNIRALVNPFDFFDGMARLIGCYQSVWNYWYKPLDYFRYVCGLNGLARYRVVGPHAQPHQSQHWQQQFTFPLPHPGTGVALIVKLLWCLGYRSGDFMVELRGTGIVEPTLALAMPFNQVATRNLWLEELTNKK